MSILDDLSVPVREFRTPAAPAPATSQETLEQWMEARFKEIERRLDSAERMASERHGWALEAIARLAEVSELRERVSRVELRQQGQ